MHRLPRIVNPQIARELLDMAERGQRIPPGLLVFAMSEDWCEIDCSRPALVAIDLLIAAEVADEIMARLRRGIPPWRNSRKKENPCR